MQSTGRFTPALRRMVSHSYDSCQHCRRSLLPDVPALAGYGSAGETLYVGPCCQSLLTELASHIYWWWEVDKRCDPNLVLWRYMDLAKFMALLEDRALYFSRADQLGDPFEGASGIAERQEEWDSFYLDFFRRTVSNPPLGNAPPPPHLVEQEAARLLANWKQARAQARITSFANCWHENTGESEALWRLYCPPPTTGVAICTTVERLERSLGEAEIRVGRVQYVDFRQGFSGVHDQIFWKRKSLSHEAEVRAVIRDWNPSPDLGRGLPVDLTTLITAVVPSPFAPPWFDGLLRKTLLRLGLPVQTQRSELLSAPFF